MIQARSLLPRNQQALSDASIKCIDRSHHAILELLTMYVVDRTSKTRLLRPHNAYVRMDIMAVVMMMMLYSGAEWE